MEATPKRAPLRITITDEGQENLVLRALLRQAVPMLLRPEAFRERQRCRLAQDITLLLEGALPLEEVPYEGEETDSGSEPGNGAEREARW